MKKIYSYQSDVKTINSRIEVLWTLDMLEDILRFDPLILNVNRKQFGQKKILNRGPTPNYLNFMKCFGST